MEAEWDHQTIIRKRRPARVDSLQSTDTKAGVRKSRYQMNKNVRDPDNLDKLVESDEIIKPKMVPTNISELVQQARQKLRWSQKDLAREANVKPSVISDLETGRAIKNEQLLGNLERILKIKLRGL